MVGEEETTAREESHQEFATKQLGVRWVWPVRRLERLARGRLSIGRESCCSIKLNGPGVSRQHAELNRQGPIYVLRDLASTNGTWLNGRAIEHAPLELGSVLRIGEWVGIVGEFEAQDIEFAELAPGIFGSGEIEKLLRPLRAGARARVPVLLVGDTGTGKERLARAVHELSGRKGPFVAVNCAALPEQLAEAELFGYRRGAFTGAERSSPGFFRSAHGGTLFLDEMPELSATLQAKLLRVVEDGVVQALGEPAGATVDVRLVSASQKPLADLVRAGRLRRDLAARLSGLELRLPPLSARRADVAPLFAAFLRQQTGGNPPLVEAKLIEALCLHDWPQNVRELELATRTLLAVYGHEGVLKRRYLPPELAALCQERPATARPAPRARSEHDVSNIKRELHSNGGNVKAAARVLGISRQRIYRLLEPTPRKQAGNERDDVCD